MRKNYIYLLFFVLINFNNLFSGSGSMIANTNNTTIYEPEHHIFHDGDVNGNLVQGFVRINDGFSIDSNATASFDTFITVSGPIDLKCTGKMVLLSSIYFDQSVTFSPMGGFIDGRENSIFLQGDLSVPDNCILNISGDTVIDGNGHDLTVGRWGQIAVDHNVTLTLRNLTLKNSYTTYTIPPIRANGINSEITLDNVHVRLADDFHFDNGKLFIHNDVIFTGTYKFSYNSTQHSRIVSDSCLYFGPDTTFEYYPSSTIDSLFVLDDRSSILYLDGCTLQTTHTGMRLTTGQLLLDNNVTLSTVGDTLWYSLTENGSLDYGTNTDSNVRCAAWSPDGTYLAIGGNYPSLIDSSHIRIYRFDGYNFRFITSIAYSTSVNNANGIFSMSWHPSGKFLAVSGIPNEFGAIRVYRFDGESIVLLDSVGGATTSLACAWRPDGEYLVTGYSDIKIYKFERQQYLFLQDSVSYGNTVYGLAWHPEGNYFVATGYQSSGFDSTDIRLYSFDGSSMTLLDSIGSGSGAISVRLCRWNATGDYIVISCDVGAANSIRICAFRKAAQALTVVSQLNFWTAYGLGWNKNNKYITVGIYNGNNLLSSILFDGESLLNDVGIQVSTSMSVPSWVEFSPDGRFCIASGSQTSPSTQPEVVLYKVNERYDTTVQTLSNGIVLGDSSIGADADLHTTLLGGSYIDLNGILIDESVES